MEIIDIQTKGDNPFEIVKLSSLLKEIVDCEHKTPKFVDGGEFFVCRTPNVRDGKIVFEDLKFTTEEDFKIWTKRRLPIGGDILFTREAPAGEVALIPQKLKLCMGQRMVLLVPNLDKINPNYLVYQFYSGSMRSFFNKLSMGTTVSRINIADIYEIKVPVFKSVKEQEAIANALSDADAYIDSLEKLIAKKRLIKKGVMQELLTGKRRLQGFKDKWITACLSDFGYTYGGLTGKTKADFGNGDARYVTFLNVINNVVLDHLLHEKVMLLEGERQNEVRENDLLFNGSSETPEEVAFCSCVKGDLKNLYLNSFCFGFRPTSKGLSSEFMAYYFRSVPGRELVKSLAQGATRYNISKTALLRAPFEIPSFDEQKAIADLLLGFDKDIFISKQKLQKARLIKQGMMQELLTGRIRLV